MSKHDNNEEEQPLKTLPKAMHHLMVDVEHAITDTERILIDVEEIEHSCNKCCLQCIWHHIVRVFCCSKDTTDDNDDYYDKMSEQLLV
jgi:hypothetical protein